MNYRLKNKSQILLGLLFMVVALAMSSPLMAQDAGSVDFKNLKSSDLSDQQVQQLWKRAQDQGYTLQDVQRLAIARGMSAAEASKLADRVRNLKQKKGKEEPPNKAQFQLRSVFRDSLLSERQNMQEDSTMQKEKEKRNRIFGASLFSRENISFAPSLSIPTPDNYQLGAGDEIVINIYGGTDENYQLQVSTEGTVSLPRVGPVYVNGLSIEEARKRLKRELSKIYSGLKPDSNGQQRSHVSISLGNIRSIHVTILGKVAAPGSYTLPSLATAFNALYVAGGPDSTGTYRNIKVIRNGSVFGTLDVYDFLASGEKINNIRLKDQDIIQVGPYDERIKLAGKTKRTGIFELRKGEDIQDLIHFSGGFSEQAYTKRISVIRETPTELSIKDVHYPEQKDFKLQNGDSVYVGKILQRYKNRIQIQGAVYRPGSYELRDTTTVYSLIKRADGVKGDAFLNRGLIYRLKDDLTTESIAFSPREVLANPATHNVELKKNDVVVISSIFDLQSDLTITVNGAVQDPGNFPFAKNMTLEDAILQSDGFDRSATPYNIEIARRIHKSDSTGFVPNEIAKTFHFSVDKNLELSDKGSHFYLEPYDQIFVRSSPSYYEQQNVTIKGQVVYPGDYTLKKQNERISDLIENAGGLTQFAYPRGANLTRITEQKIDTAFVNIEDTLSSSQQIVSNKTKVGINLEKIMGHPHSKYDLILRKGDILEIPKELQTVKISGEVLQPVSVRYEKGRSFRDYIRAAGGPTNMGKRKDAYIVYANGEVDRANKFLFFRNYPKVRPGATIFVPKKEEKEGLPPQVTVGIFSTLVSTLAIIINVLR